MPKGRTPNVKKLEEDKDVSGLIKALGFKGDISVRSDAAKALGLIGGTRAVDALISALSDNDLYVRGSSVMSLGDIGDDHAVDALIERLKDQEEIVRWYAASALGKIGDTRAVEPLVELLKYEYYAPYEALAKGLVMIGAPAREPLKAA